MIKIIQRRNIVFHYRWVRCVYTNISIAIYFMVSISVVLSWSFNKPVTQTR